MNTQTLTSVFRTYVEGNLLYEGASLEDAIRVWDGNTYNLNRSVAGGIAVASFDGDTQVRDGWILHVMEDGTCYLNPRLSTK